MKKANNVISEKWKLIWPDVKRALRGLAYAAIGAVAAFALSYIQVFDFGVYQPFMAMPISFLANILNKLITRAEYVVTTA